MDLLLARVFPLIADDSFINSDFICPLTRNNNTYFFHFSYIPRYYKNGNISFFIKKQNIFSRNKSIIYKRKHFKFAINDKNKLAFFTTFYFNSGKGHYTNQCTNSESNSLSTTQIVITCLR